MFFKIVVLKNFAIFAGKHLCCSLFLIKVAAALKSVFIKKRRDSKTGVFFEYCKILKNSFFVEHVWWLFLYVAVIKNSCSEKLLLRKIAISKNSLIDTQGHCSA